MFFTLTLLDNLSTKEQLSLNCALSSHERQIKPLKVAVAARLTAKQLLLFPPCSAAFRCLQKTQESLL